MLFVVVRPLAVWLVTLRAGLPLGQRLLIGWLGIRGIGSLNYIAYARRTACKARRWKL